MNGEVGTIAEPDVRSDGHQVLPVGIHVTSGRIPPILRVEELKDEGSERSDMGLGGGSTGSSIYGTDDEAGLSGEASDQDKERDVTGEDDSQPIGEFQIPSDELKNRIITQVEFYFSDANILKDAFMLKHVRRNKMGYVSLKLITSFRKVKSLTKDFRAVAYSLRQSTKLEVNEEGTKVRRIDPLPEHDETTPSRTVIAANLPTSNPTVESIAEIFTKHGEVALVRIIRPGKQIPADIKRFMGKHPEIGGQNVCAVVEFETYEAAARACAGTASETDNWRTGMRVVLLHQPKGCDGKKGSSGDGSTRNAEGNADGKSNDKDKKSSNKGKGGYDGKHSGDEGRCNKSGREGGRKSWRVDELAQEGRCTDGRHGDGDGMLSGSSDAECDSHSSSTTHKLGGVAHKVLRSSLSPQQDLTRLSPHQSPRSTPKSSPRSSPKSSPSARRRSLHTQSPLTTGEGGGGSPAAGNSPSQSPWVQRRMKAALESSPLVSSAGNSPIPSPRLGRKEPGGGNGTEWTGGSKFVIRQPRGPDGTRGFHSGSRGKVVEIVEEGALCMGILKDGEHDFRSEGGMNDTCGHV